jgi:superfamily II DNA or RNA helicase
MEWMTMSLRSCEAGSGNACALAEHQRDALRRLEEILDRRGGAILADEPGLGKSFIAAAIAADRQECELVVPASLVGQWQETLRRFGSSARVVTHDRIEDGVARGLIIVDEAHAFRNPRTRRYDALARRSARAQLLLVTATPVCNSARDLEALAGLIASDDALRDAGVPSIDAAFAQRDLEALHIITGELVVRRDRSVLPETLQFGALDRRVVRFEPFTAGGEIPRLIESLRFPLIADNALLRQFLWRRLTSSEAAFLESLRRQRRFYERALECLAAGRALPKRAYRRLFGHEEDAGAFQTVLFWDVFVPADSSAGAAEIEEEMRRLDSLRQLADSSPREKRSRLVELCGSSEEPMLIFTGWAATAIDLFEAASGVRRAALVTGRERRRGGEAIESFCAGFADVLVCTDLAAEGLNLQRAGIVVHYDVPWNPVKLDQRNGRAHRIGQRRGTVIAYYFLSSRDPVMRIVARKKRITKALSAQHPAGHIEVRTLRPRVTNPAARTWPRQFQRRNKAGIERLLTAGNLDGLL